MRTPLVIAHRGGAGEAPENTEVAFRRAIDLGCDGIECDVRRSADGELLVHHDREVRLSAGASVPRTCIDGASAEVLLSADLGWTHGDEHAGTRMPTLAAFLGLAGADVARMVEIKPGVEEERVAQDVARLVAGDARRSGWVFASFSAALLWSLHREAPDVALQGIADDPDAIGSFTGLPLAGWGLSRDIVTAERVAALRAEGRFVWTWTVADVTQVAPLVAAGVDGLITDVPGAVLEMLGRTS